MFCTNCGTQLPDDASFCMSCGAKVLKPATAPQEPPLQPSVVSASQPASVPDTQTDTVPTSTSAVPEDTVPAEAIPPQPVYPPQPDTNHPYQPQSPYCAPPVEPPQPEYPMKWFKFVIYFQLFFGAFVNLCNTVLYCSGALYGNDSDLVYAAFGGLRVLDILMGVICLALAAYSIFVRFQLAKFKRNAPVLLYILLACNAGFNLFYSIGSTIIIGQNLISATTIGNLIGTLILLALNVVYFNKRKSLFIH